MEKEKGFLKIKCRFVKFCVAIMDDINEAWSH